MDLPEPPSPGLATVTPPSPEPAIVEYRPLDRRVITLWRVNALISWALLACAGLGVAIGVGAALEWSLWVRLSLWGLLVGLLLWWMLWLPARRYRAWGYRLDDKVLELRSGVWWRVWQLLPLSRMQHVDLQRGPMERMHGLASLVLHTAGTHGSTIVLPGLDAAEAARLRDQLVLAGGDDAV